MWNEKTINMAGDKITFKYMLEKEKDPNNLGKGRISKMTATFKGKEVANFDKNKGGWIKKTSDFTVQAATYLLVQQTNN